MLDVIRADMFWSKEMAKTIVAGLAARVFDAGLARGVPEGALRSAVGKARIQLGPNDRVPIECVFACFDTCMRHTRDPAFPMHVASTVTMEDYSVLGFALMTSPSARAAFARLERYSHIISDSGVWDIRETKEGVELQWIRAGRRTLGHRVANECSLAELVCGLRRAFGNISPKQVYFRHEAPAKVASHKTLFRAPIAWGAPRDSVVYGPELLALNPSEANIPMSEFFDNVLLTHHRKSETQAERVRNAILRGLPSGQQTANELAGQLGMSERSLRRALQAENTSLREILDDVRRTIALEMLDANKSATEIAFILGFSETSALSRAFRRWYGSTIRAHAASQR
jgi:AraC-like DNA-binding protein